MKGFGNLSVRLFTAWLAALLVAACGGGIDGATAPVPSPQRPAVVVPGTWVVMGSSSAYGAGATSGHSWATLLGSAHAGDGANLVNLARRGALTYQAMPAAFAPPPGRPLPDAAVNVDAALTRTPRLVILSFPSNDTAMGYSVDETVSNLLAIRARALATTAAVVVVSTQPRNSLPADRRARLAEIDTRLAATTGPCFVAVHAALADADDGFAAAYSTDGVHPNDAGHRVIFERIEAVLRAGQCLRLQP